MDPRLSCASCGRPIQKPRMEERSFPFGEDKVELVATFPVYECTFCDIEFTDELGEVARHIAACKHLGILEPRRIMSMRGERHMTQRVLAKIMGVDEARVQGWEFGTVFQTKEQDNHLRRIFAQTPIPPDEK